MRLTRSLPFVALLLVTACSGPAPRPPTCEDGVTNGDETDVDCGNDCEPCGVGAQCGTGRGCVTGVCTSGTCAAPTCTDAVQNGTETGTDCGGECTGCQGGLSCESPDDCASGICIGGICASSSCSDGLKNGDESDVDCGGMCAPCALARVCIDGADCQTGVCVQGACAAASCTDALHNGTETDVDCGGAACGDCAVGKICGSGADCATGICNQGACAAATCTDGAKNQDEADVDCGGTCAACPNGSTCANAVHCQSGICLSQVCVAPSCSDNLKNQDETDVDCGGSVCAACAAGRSCVKGSDCVTGLCSGGACVASACGDSVVTAGEQCDDGNKVSGDGCSATCQLEGLVQVLLIPDSGDHSVGMYSPSTGAYLGNFLGPRQTTDPWTFSTPQNATPGPNGEVWVTDQVSDNISRFKNDGTFIAQFAGTTQGLDNVRGLEFFGGQAYVANGSTTVGVLRFDVSTGTNAGVHFAGSSPWDLLFRSDGSAVVTIDSGLWRYPAGGGARTQLLSLSFPQQVAHGPSGNLLVTAFSSGSVTEVTSTGTAVRSQPLSSARGVHLLDNGQWLVTAAGSTTGGVFVMDPVAGTKTTIHSGGGYRMIERAFVAASLLP